MKNQRRKFRPDPPARTGPSSLRLHAVVFVSFPIRSYLLHHEAKAILFRYQLRLRFGCQPALASVMNNALRARRWSLANLKIIAPAFILSGLVNRRNEFCWNFSGRVSFNSEYMKRLKDGDPETKRHFIA